MTRMERIVICLFIMWMCLELQKFGMRPDSVQRGEVPKDVPVQQYPMSISSHSVTHVKAHRLMSLLIAGTGV